MRRSLLLLLALLLALLGLNACGSKSQSSSSNTSSSAATPPPPPPPPTPATKPTAGKTAQGCRKISAPAPKGQQHLAKPTLKLDPAKTYELVVDTNCGSFTIRLDPKRNPKTSASLYYLAKRGFFDGLTFHRVSAGFVIQGGDPLGDGSGGPGYTVVEPPPRSARYPRGTIAMAKTQSEPPGASGSQFFVVTAADATSTLGGQYAIGGQVVKGQGVVQRIGSIPTSPPQDGPPVDAVVMSKVTAKVR